MASNNNWINSAALREADRSKNTKNNHADALRKFVYFCRLPRDEKWMIQSKYG